MSSHSRRVRYAGGFAALCLVFMVAGLSSLRPLSHDDVFWHMRTGEIIVQEGAVPTTDPFSYTRYGASWVSHEWGYGLLLHAIHAAFGLPGLVALQVAFVVAIFGALARLLTRTRPVPVGAEAMAPVLLALGLWAAHHEMKLNPALFTTLFLAIELRILGELRRRMDGKTLAAFVTLFLVWSNVHSGVLFGLMVLGFWLLEGWARALGLDQRFETPAPGAATPRARLAVLAGASALTLLNPNGIEAPLYPVRLSLFLFGTDLPLDMGHFTAPTPLNRPGFFALAGLLVAGLALGRRWRSIPLSEALGAAMFFFLSLRSSRFIFDFVVLSLPVFYRAVAPLGRTRAASRFPMATAAALFVAAAVGARDLPKCSVSEHFPEKAVDFLRRESIDGTLFNHQNYGGYLSWRLDTPVFWDGRNDVFGPLMEELVGLSFDEIMDRWKVDVLLITDRQYQPFRERLQRGPWALVYWDDFSAVYLRRLPRFRDVVERHEYREFPPFDTPSHPPNVAAIAADPERMTKVRSELERVLSANPRTQRAWYYLGLLSLHTGDLQRARREIARAESIRPHAQVTRVLRQIEGSIVPDRKDSG